MADYEDEVNSQQEDNFEEEEVWEDPVEDVDALEDGPRTIIVGGTSRIETIDDALERYRGPGDRIVIMPGMYETGMILDAGKYPRLQIYGAFPGMTELEEKIARQKQREREANAEEIEEQEAMNRWLPPPVFGPARDPVVVFKGKLTIQNQENEAAGYEEEEAENGGIAHGAVPKLTVSNITFQGGASISEEADVVLTQCNFGIPFVPPQDASNKGDDAVREQRTVRVHALATPTFTRCRIFGAERSALYCYPFARGQFENCDIVGMVAAPSQDELNGAAGGIGKGRRLAANNNRSSTTTTGSSSSATKPPLKCLSDAGVHLDDAGCSFHQCAVHNFNLGVVTNDPCEGTKLTECSVFEISTVGYLFGANCKVNVRECKGRVCGREVAVFGSRSHVSMRDCQFSGDVRLKDEAVLSALVDNYVGPEVSNWKIMNEAKQFADRGFSIVEDDPSLRKKRKPAPVEE